MAKRSHPDDTNTQSDGNRIHLVVTDQDGNKTYFKVEINTRLKTLFSSYNRKHNQLEGVLTFLYKGNRINPQATPARLGVEDGDEITCMEHFSGGCLLTRK